MKKVKEKIEQLASKLAKYLDGKKTILGILGHAGLVALNIFNKDIMTTSQQLEGHLLIGTVTSTGIVHKFIKWWTRLKKR